MKLKRRIFWLLVGFLGMLFTFGAFSGQTDNQDYNPLKSHHRPDGFANRYYQLEKNPGFWKWQWERRMAGLPKPPTEDLNGVTPRVDELKTNQSEPTVTWVGHSTVLLQLDGLNILTDPIWANRASPVSFWGPKRHQPPGIPFEDLPHIDVVLISHNHYDHLNFDTVQRLMKQAGGPPRFFVPLGVQYWFKEHVEGSLLEGENRNVFAFDWDQDIELPGKTAPIKFEFLAVQHWSARAFNDRFATLWGSWAVLHPDFRFWFSGDLGYSPDTASIGERFGYFDFAAIAIGAYEPRWFMKTMHIDPEEAVKVMREVGARQAFGIHWGTFEDMTDESLDQPPKDLAKAVKAAGMKPDDFFVLRHGETWPWRDSPPVMEKAAD